MFRVAKCEPDQPTGKQFVRVVNEAIEENQLFNAKIILLSFDCEFDDDQQLNELAENVIVLKNIVRALDKVGNFVQKHRLFYFFRF